MRAQFRHLFPAFLLSLLVLSCSPSWETQERLDNSIPEDVTLNVALGGSSRAERFLGTFDEIDRLTLTATSSR